MISLWTGFKKSLVFLLLLFALIQVGSGSAFAGGAPGHIKAVCVIADFPNNKLEDCRTATINSVAKLKPLLEKMSEHWAWMSCDQQTMDWTIIRVTASRNLADDSYGSWVDFRSDVVSLAGEQLDFADHDADNDGVLDVMWILAATRNQENADYCRGGAGQVPGRISNGERVRANTFLDGQDSYSVKCGAYGNFNHEIGHCFGLPDLYGECDRLKYLSLMSDSWPVPAFGFCAYDRVKLGWVEPMLVESTKYDLELKPAETNLQCIKIPTSSPAEYFLVEYRKKPTRGFGSLRDHSHPAYDGLAIYHVDERRILTGNSTDPPLVSLESPQGFHTGMPTTNDFWYPRNPKMKGPFVAASNDGRLCGFHLEVTSIAKESIRLNVIFDDHVEVAETPPINLLADGSFETEAFGRDWFVDTFRGNEAAASFEDRFAHDGETCLCLETLDFDDDCRVLQAVAVRSHTPYCLSGWVRTQGVKSWEGSCGANLSIVGGWERSASLLNDHDWTYLEVYFDSGDRQEVDVCCRLGFYGSTVVGRAWFDDIRLVETD